MEYAIKSISGAPVLALYNGAKLVIYSDYYGTLAVAECVYYSNSEKVVKFALKYGNRHTIGGSLAGSVILSGAEKIARFFARKYVDMRVIFTETTPTDLADTKPAEL